MTSLKHSLDDLALEPDTPKLEFISLILSSFSSQDGFKSLLRQIKLVLNAQ